MANRANETRANGHRENENRADIVAPTAKLYSLILSQWIKNI